MERVVTPEFMDDPALPADDLARTLAFIRFVNRWLLGSHGLLRHLRPWSRRWPRDRPVTLLDIGTGSADIPIRVRAWAERAGFDVRVTAVDLHPGVLDVARRHVAGRPGIELVQANALHLMEHFKPESFDYVHAGMFLHHLPFIQVLTVLRIMDRLARRGIVWNDLVRSRLSLGVLRVLLIGHPEIVRHDAIVSVRAGFTRGEATDYARRADIGYARYRDLLSYRFTLAGERTGAW